MNAVFDSNVLIDYLNGARQARAELERYDRISISAVTWIEVMAGATPVEEPAVRAFLATFTVEDVTQAVAERALEVRRARRLRLPDAIIWATARELGQLFVTRNTRDFPRDDPGVRIPYRL